MRAAKVDLTKCPVTVRDENKASCNLLQIHKGVTRPKLKGTVPALVGKNKAGLPSSHKVQWTRMFPRKETRERDRGGPGWYRANMWKLKAASSTASEADYSVNWRQAGPLSSVTGGVSAEEVKWDKGAVALTKHAFVANTTP